MHWKCALPVCVCLCVCLLYTFITKMQWKCALSAVCLCMSVCDCVCTHVCVWVVYTFITKMHVGGLGVVFCWWLGWTVARWWECSGSNTHLVLILHFLANIISQWHCDWLMASVYFMFLFISSSRTVHLSEHPFVVDVRVMPDVILCHPAGSPPPRLTLNIDPEGLFVWHRIDSRPGRLILLLHSMWWPC